eukprot:gene16221-23489_t
MCAPLADGLQDPDGLRGRVGPTGVALGTPSARGRGRAFKTDPLIDAQLGAFRASGYAVGDYNDLRNTGAFCGRTQYNIRDGERSSSDLILRDRLAAGTAYSMPP